MNHKGALIRILPFVLLMGVSSACKRLSIRSVLGSSSVSSAAGPFCGGAGTIGNPYTICTVAHLEELNGFVTNGKYFKLQADLDLSTITTKPIITGDPCVGFGCLANAFHGDLDGNNHKLSNYTMNSTGQTYSGLFEAVQQGTIHDLVIEDFNITGNGNNAGFLAGLVRMVTATNITIQGSNSITATDAVGGLFGTNDSAIISTGTFTGIKLDRLELNAAGSYIGGIIGESKGSITISSSSMGTGLNAFTFGNYANAYFVGGFIGVTTSALATATISNSIINTGVSIHADMSMGMSGGFIGSASGTTNFVSVMNNGDNDSSMAGGLIGQSLGIYIGVSKSGNNGHIGGQTINNGVSAGLIGYCDGSCNVSESVNHGLIELNYDYGGGLVGYSSSSLTISNSYNDATVTGPFSKTGGLFGGSNSTTTITNCHVSSPTLFGGVSVHTIGAEVENSATITGTVWNDDNMTAMSSDQWPLVNAGTHAYTNANMGLLSSFTGGGPPDVSWDFATIWVMPGGGLPPALQWE